MYGLGIYMADMAQKSHRYVREPSSNVGDIVAATPSASGRVASRMLQQRKVYSMLRCRVCLGNPYLIEANLMRGDAMHNMCWCQNPSDMIESCTEEWCTAKGHDSFFVRGLSGAQKAGLGVINNEYILFQPFQVLPLYKVDYVLQ